MAFILGWRIIKYNAAAVLMRDRYRSGIQEAFFIHHPLEQIDTW